MVCCLNFVSGSTKKYFSMTKDISTEIGKQCNTTIKSARYKFSRKVRSQNMGI